MHTSYEDVTQCTDDHDSDNGETQIQVTPHKRAEFNSPGKNVSSRKKKRNPNMWKRNIRKVQRNKCQEYINEKGKRITARSMKSINCTKWRFKCSDKISNEKRQSIFESYWNIGNFERQRQFICQHIPTTDPKRKSDNPKKTASNQFHFTVNNTKVRICR